MSASIRYFARCLPVRPRGCGLAGALLAAALLAALLALALAPPPAAAQDGELRSLIERVDRLQRELNTLQRSIYRGEAVPAQAERTVQAQAADDQAAPTLAARTQLRVARMEEELTRLTGQIEEIRFRVKQVSERLDKLVEDVDFRLRELEQATPRQVGRAEAAGDSGSGTERPAQAAGGEGGESQFDTGPKTLGTVSEGAVEELRQQQVERAGRANAEAAAGGEQTAAKTQERDYELPGDSPQAQYDHAFGLLRQADYDDAERALAAFLKAHPEHELAGNAKYWLGETYYVRGYYRQAAVAFAEGFERYPESNKAADNLLKLGMSLAQLGSKQDACDTLAELLRRYDDAAANVRQKAQLERQRLGCG